MLAQNTGVHLHMQYQGLVCICIVPYWEMGVNDHNCDFPPKLSCMRITATVGMYWQQLWQCARQITLATKCSQSTSFHANIKCTVVATTVLSPYWRKVRLGRIKLTGHRFLWQLSLSKLNTCCSLCVKFDWEMYRLWMKEWTENKSFSYTKAAGTKTLFGPVHLEIWIYCKLFCSGKYLLCLLLQLIRLRWEVLPH